MITSQKWRSTTAAILALGIGVATGAPLMVAAPAAAQRISEYERGRISQFESERVPQGTVIPVTYEKDKIVVTREETAPLTLTVARDIRTSQGRILIPAGSQIVGELQPVRRGDRSGTQFVARELFVSRRQRYRIDANSGIITRTERVQKGAGTGSIAQGAALGAAAAAAAARAAPAAAARSPPPPYSLGVRSPASPAAAPGRRPGATPPRRRRAWPRSSAARLPSSARSMARW